MIRAAALLVVLGPLLLPAGASATQTALLPIGGDLAPEQRNDLEGLLRAELSRTQGVELISSEKTREEVSAAEQLGLSCTEEDAACLAQLASLLQVDQVVLVQASQAAYGVQLRMDVIDGKGGVRINRVEVEIPLTGPARLQRMREGVLLLLEPERLLGSIRVAAPDGAEILLDGQVMGTAPLAAPLTGVRAGTHLLKARLPDGREGALPLEVPAGAEAFAELTVAFPAPDDTGPAPDEKIALDDDAPLDEGGLGWGMPLVVAGGVGAVLGLAATSVTGGGALALDQILWWTAVGDNPQRDAMLWGGRALLVASVASAGVLVMGGAAVGVGLAVGLAE